MKKIFQLKFSFTFFIHILKAIFYKYHKDKGYLIQKILKKPEIIIDVGAHAGQFLKMVSSSYNNKVKIIAIEPGLYARSILRLSIFFNRLKNIFVIPMAVSDQKDFSFLNIPEKRKNSFGFGLSHMSTDCDDFLERNFKIHYDYVSVTTIDQIVKDLEIEKVDLIKMDIEGFEYKALLGASETLEKFKPIIYIELMANSLNRNNDSLNDVYNFLRKLNYKSYCIKDSDLEEFNENKEDDAVFFISDKDPTS